MQPDHASAAPHAVAGLLNTAPCGFLTFSDDGIVRAVNTTLLEMLGYQNDDVVGHHIEQLFNVGTRIFYQTHWFPLLRMHGRAEEVFLLMRAHTGESLGMLSYAKRRDAESGHYDCVFVHVRERAKYEDELLRAKHALEESNKLLYTQKSELVHANELLESQAVELELQQVQLETVAEALQLANEALQTRTEEAELLRRAADDANHAKSAFLAMMSHELRTPLNAIGGYLQILQLGIAGPVPDQQREILVRLEKSSQHLLRLINEVLDLSRIEAGHVHYEIERAVLLDVVAGVTPMVEPQFAAKGVRFFVDVPVDLMISADVEKVSQIIINLLGNASKFTADGGVVELTATRATPPGGVDVHVRDTGVGIPADKLEAIFQPFVQVDSSRTRTAEGSGLGLAISRDLARGMGGDLTVKSAVGSGSTFTLTLRSPA